MKRDMDLIRELLLQIEARPADAGPFEPKVEGVDTSTIREHLILMDESGLIDSIIRKSIGVAMPVLPKRLTMSGHDFLDNIRDDTMWKKTKDVATEKGVGWTIETLVAIARTLALNAIS